MTGGPADECRSLGHWVKLEPGLGFNCRGRVDEIATGRVSCDRGTWSYDGVTGGLVCSVTGGLVCMVV